LICGASKKTVPFEHIDTDGKLLYSGSPMKIALLKLSSIIFILPPLSAPFHGQKLSRNHQRQSHLCRRNRHGIGTAYARSRRMVRGGQILRHGIGLKKHHSSFFFTPVFVLLSLMLIHKQTCANPKCKKFT